MELKIRKNGEIYIIDVNGEMDLYNSYKLKELVMKMLEKNVHSFVINLEQVDYIDSSGIGALIYICSTIKKLNLKLFAVVALILNHSETAIHMQNVTCNIRSFIACQETNG